MTHPLKRYEPQHSVKRRRIPVAYAVIIAFVLSGVAVLSTSRAAFTDTTDNSGNSVATGNVELADDDSGVAAFAVTDMAPGDSVTRCIKVTYQGSIADPDLVKMYSGGYTDSGTLGDELLVTIDQGSATSGGDFTDCTGFDRQRRLYNDVLSGFDAAATDYATGLGNWNPSATPESRVYRIKVELPATATDAVQDSSVTDLAFVWEVQS